MQRKNMFLVAAIAFFVASVFSFYNHFTGNPDSNIYFIFGAAFAVLGFPMLLMRYKESKKTS